MSRIKGRESLNRMPIIGKIKIGEKKKNNQGKEYPVSIDYFRATGMYSALFHKHLGEKPQKLRIIFPSNNIEDICNQRLELRDNKGRLFAYSDSKIYNVFNRKTNEYDEIVPDNPDKYAEKIRNKCNGKWDEILIMKFMLLELKGINGVWQLYTKGKNSSIPNLINIFDHVYNTAQNIAGIPFDLTIEKVKSQKPDSKSIFPVLNLIPNISADSMNVLGEFINHGQKMKRLCVLTEEKINELEVKALDTGKTEEQPINTINQPRKTQEKEAESDLNIINSTDRKRIFATAKGDKDLVKKIITHPHYGYESTKDIFKKDLLLIVREIEEFISDEMIGRFKEGSNHA